MISLSRFAAAAVVASIVGTPRDQENFPRLRPDDFLRVHGSAIALERPIIRHWDVEAGLTRLEAITVATTNGARFLRQDDRIGTLVAGKRADITVVRGDPSTRIEDIEQVEIVFKAGVGYDSVKLRTSVRGQVGHPVVTDAYPRS